MGSYSILWIPNNILGDLLSKNSLDRMIEEMEMRDEVAGGLVLALSRIFVPVTLVVLGMILWSLELSTMVIAILLGIALGPLVGLHRLYFHLRLIKSQEEGK